jgi:hypothetical protein
MTRLRGRENALVFRPDLDPGACRGFDRLYLGSEFCERRLPGDRRLGEAAALCRERGMALTLVTPYLSDGGVAELSRLLARPGLARVVSEVVFNDWGVPGLLRRHLPGAAPVLGRLLVSQHDAVPGAGQQRCFPEAHLDLLAELGVTRLEFNDHPHFLAARAQLRERGMRAHLHHPFAYTTTSRYCNAARGYARFLPSPDTPCGRECERSLGIMQHPRFAREVVVEGNTSFIRQDDPAAGQPAPRRVIHHLHLDRLRHPGAAGAGP